MGTTRLVVALGALLLLGCEGANRGGYGDVRDEIAKHDAAIATKKAMLMEQGLSEKEISMKLNEEFGAGPISFKDDVQSNATLPSNLEDLVFVKPSEGNPAGEQVRFADLLGKKRILLIVTRGYSGGSICPFCVTQTRQLASRYDDFQALNTEVIIVYPGDGEHLDEFLSAASIKEKAELADVRWDVVIDPDLSAVKLLDIAADLAAPSNFLFDENGKLAFAYVGADRTDRPSVKALLEKIEQLDAE